MAASRFLILTLIYVLFEYIVNSIVNGCQCDANCQLFIDAQLFLIDLKLHVIYMTLTFMVNSCYKVFLTSPPRTAVNP